MTPPVSPRALAAVATASLAGNAAVHLALAGPFDGNPGGLLSQGMLFRIQAAADLLVGAAAVLLPRVPAAVAALVVALAGAGVLTGTTVVPLDGTPAGLPYLFEPSWYPLKTAALTLQLAAAAAAGLLLVRLRTRALPSARRG